MTQSLLEKEEQDAPESGTAAPTGVGPTLRSMREARRISVNEVSQRLKFSVRQIEALEAEDWSRLPTGVPLRGFVRNYARYMEADVESVLVLLDNQVGPTAPRSIMAAPGIAPSVSRDAEIPTSPEGAHRPWGWLLIILALLIIAGFYAIDRGWVPESWLVFDWLRDIANND
ncbi:MAG TPA: helix-turn-helix transcriptional regulator [Burkholderiaceae bacterium]|nr:helix-turn-helix domain-containing protein [bacterium SGD-2]HZH56447.1 helix-turn-helix transcriptional regulator [Burkholderiaceae bacterium]